MLKCKLTSSVATVIGMTIKQYPDYIKSLAKAKIPFPGVQGWVAQGKEFQLVFFEIESGGQVSPHSHGEQYGYVFEGEMILTIGEETRTYRAGESYHIPKGVIHHAKFNTFVRVMDFFLEADRYTTE
ncbi:MAG: cupin domain-containing protein [Candidatus Thorarchaeota archaeon]|nr:cupin domain-containing protein [Candidatus Thorarchaeota archaeon]